jgi:serine/threonine-protein kinase
VPGPTTQDHLLGGRYRLLEAIGAGGMGTVHRAHDTRLDRPVAVKLLRAGEDIDDLSRARLQAEARFAGALHHAGIVRVYD